MRNVYYRSLVRWEIVDEIIELADPDEREQTHHLIIRSIDHIVMETALHHLSKEEHEKFLQMCHEAYHDEGILDWLKEKAEGVEEAIKNGIRETKEVVRGLLKNDHPDENDVVE